MSMKKTPLNQQVPIIFNFFIYLFTFILTFRFFLLLIFEILRFIIYYHLFFLSHPSSLSPHPPSPSLTPSLHSLPTFPPTLSLSSLLHLSPSLTLSHLSPTPQHSIDTTGSTLRLRYRGPRSTQKNKSTTSIEARCRSTTMCKIKIEFNLINYIPSMAVMEINKILRNTVP